MKGSALAPVERPSAVGSWSAHGAWGQMRSSRDTK